VIETLFWIGIIAASIYVGAWVVVASCAPELPPVWRLWWRRKQAHLEDPARRLAELDAWFDRTYPDSYTVIDSVGGNEIPVKTQPELFQVLIKNAYVYHKYSSGKVVLIGLAKDHVPAHIRPRHYERST